MKKENLGTEKNYCHSQATLMQKNPFRLKQEVTIRNSTYTLQGFMQPLTDYHLTVVKTQSLD